MSVQDMTKLVAHALKDDQFRRQLVDNPEDAIQAAGFQLTEEELEAVKSVDLGLSQEELEERVSKIWGAPAPANPFHGGGMIGGGGNLTTVAP